jgi:DNA modification methylase
VIRWALGNYGREGSALLDPFTGSGTAQVEASVRGISSVGIDIDPLACLVTKAKVTPLDPYRLTKCLDDIERRLISFRDGHSTYERQPGADITPGRFADESGNLWVPAIPGIFHWFRRYVVVDLARLFRVIDDTDLTRHERLFFRICVAATIRTVCNADPAPVSGLEVTAMQAKLNATRRIAVFKEFLLKTRQKIEGMSHLWSACRLRNTRAVARVVRGDSTDVEKVLRHESLAARGFPLVITSPPYCSAVEYGRRHQLEMYWLRLVEDAAQRVELCHSYIGRRLVRSRDWDKDVMFGIKGLDTTVNAIAGINANKGRTIRHYFYAIQQALAGLARVIRPTGTFICVIGDSTCCNLPIRTSDFLVELMSDVFTLRNRFSYALRNHYMQYGLWNGHGIKTEHVLVFKPR